MIMTKFVSEVHINAEYTRSQETNFPSRNRLDKDYLIVTLSKSLNWSGLNCAAHLLYVCT